MFGFTLIELLISISIIGIVVTIASASFITTQKGARDSQRKGHINAYRGALEQYANANGGVYPVRTAQTDVKSTGCLGLNPTYIGACVGDPREGIGTPAQLPYKYQSDADGIRYCVWADLEGSASYFEACSDGRIGEVSTPPTMTL